jgi:hypothetical protein
MLKMRELGETPAWRIVSPAAHPKILNRVFAPAEFLSANNTEMALRRAGAPEIYIDAAFA